MLRYRVIPIVLIDGFSVLKTIQFNQRRNLGSPITVARTYNTRNVDELILLDIDAAKQNRSIDIFTVRDIAMELFMPLTIGGGIKSTEDIAQVLANGADKVSLNMAALHNPQIIREASSLFGSQCIVASIDVKKVGDRYKVYSHVDKRADLDLFEWIESLEELGAGEILLNNVDRDGSMNGLDTELIARVSERVSIPLIVAGGVSAPQDCVNAIRSGASAIGVSSIFHFTSFTPRECKKIMSEHGIPVRQ